MKDKTNEKTEDNMINIPEGFYNELMKINYIKQLFKGEKKPSKEERSKNNVNTVESSSWQFNII